MTLMDELARNAQDAYRVAQMRMGLVETVARTVADVEALGARPLVERVSGDVLRITVRLDGACVGEDVSAEDGAAAVFKRRSSHGPYPVLEGSLWNSDVTPVSSSSEAVASMADDLSGHDAGLLVADDVADEGAGDILSRIVAESAPQDDAASQAEAADDTAADDTAADDTANDAANDAADALKTGPLSAAERDVFEKMADEGLSCGEIAERMGRSKQNIGTHLYQYKRRVQAVRAVAHQPVATEADGPCWETALKRGPWSESEERALVDMAARGLSGVDIAERLQRAVPATKKKRSQLRAEIKAAVAALSGEDGVDVVPVEGAPSEAQLAAHLDAVGSCARWDVAADLRLIDMVVRGAGVAGAAAVLRIDREEARARYKRLTAIYATPGDLSGLLALLRARSLAVAA